MTNYTEPEIAVVAVDVIRRRPGIHTSELIDEVRSMMRPTGSDCDILEGRNDDKFSQKVRNLKSHDSLLPYVTTIGDKDRQWFPKP